MLMHFAVSKCNNFSKTILTNKHVLKILVPLKKIIEILISDGRFYILLKLMFLKKCRFFFFFFFITHVNTQNRSFYPSF